MSSEGNQAQSSEGSGVYSRAHAVATSGMAVVQIEDTEMVVREIVHPYVHGSGVVEYWVRPGWKLDHSFSKEELDGMG